MANLKFAQGHFVKKNQEILTTKRNKETCRLQERLTRNAWIEKFSYSGIFVLKQAGHGGISGEVVEWAKANVG